MNSRMNSTLTISHIVLILGMLTPTKFLVQTLFKYLFPSHPSSFCTPSSSSTFSLIHSLFTHIINTFYPDTCQKHNYHYIRDTSPQVGSTDTMNLIRWATISKRRKERKNSKAWKEAEAEKAARGVV